MSEGALLQFDSRKKLREDLMIVMQAFEVVREIANISQPFQSTGWDGHTYCIFCDEVEHDGHDVGCVWLKAQELQAMLPEADVIGRGETVARV